MAKIKTKYVGKIMVGDSILLKEGDNWSEPYKITYIDERRNVYYYGDEGYSLSGITLQCMLQRNLLEIIQKEV